MLLFFKYYFSEVTYLFNNIYISAIFSNELFFFYCVQFDFIMMMMMMMTTTMMMMIFLREPTAQTVFIE